MDDLPDTGALDAARMSNPLPQPTQLLVDCREPDDIIAALKEVPNLDVDVAQLKVGDYVVPGRLIIERKTSADLAASLTRPEQRLLAQAMAMCEAGCQGLVLIEGGAYAQTRVSLAAVTGALTHLTLVDGIPVIETIDKRHSVYTIVKCVRHALYGRGYLRGLRPSAPKRAQLGEARSGPSYVLQGISGISAAKAQALLEAFGTLRAVAAADPKTLKQVKGIGPELCRRVHAAFNTDVREKAQ